MNADNDSTSSAAPKKWIGKDGTVIACTEKLKVLNENWEELHTALQDALDDAVLMGCTVNQFKLEYKRLIDSLVCEYQEQTEEDSKR